MSSHFPAPNCFFPDSAPQSALHQSSHFPAPNRFFPDSVPQSALHQSSPFPAPNRFFSDSVPSSALHQLLSFFAPRCLVPNPVPHDLLLRPVSSLVMLGLMLRFLLFASFRWPESNSAVFRNARCLMLAKTLRPLNIYGTCACAYLYIRADGNQKAAASLVPCGEREAGGGLVGRDGSRVWDGGQICHHFFLGFSGAMLYSSRMMSS